MSTLLMLAGGGLMAASSIQEGNAQAAAAKANADVYSLQARQALQAGNYEEQKLLLAKKKAQSTQQALYAKSGVLFTEGSPIEVMAATATEYEMDIRANRYNAQVEAAKYNYMSENEKLMAKRYKQTGYTKAIGSILLSTGAVMKGQTPSPGTTGGANTTSYGVNVPSTYTPAH